MNRLIRQIMWFSPQTLYHGQYFFSKRNQHDNLLYTVIRSHLKIYYFQYPLRMLEE